MIGLAAFTEDHHLVGYDLNGGVLYAFLVFPPSGLQAAFNINLLALGQVLFTNFSQISPSDDIEPLGFGVAFAIRAIPGSAGGDGEGGDRAGYSASRGRDPNDRSPLLYSILDSYPAPSQ
jgi:hypothetical protein